MIVGRQQRAVWLAVAGLTLVGACFHRAPEPIPASPQLPVQQIEPPSSALPGTTSPAPDVIEAPEAYIDLVAEDGDVRLILQRIAEVGKIDLIIPSNIRRRISVRYVHVPASVALRDVLQRSGLRLGTGTTGPLPFDTITVFYRLPVNVDSLSIDGIMKRFGVSRDLAEMIAKSRPPER
jgi:hypothetical protein